MMSVGSLSRLTPMSPSPTHTHRYQDTSDTIRRSFLFHQPNTSTHKEKKTDTKITNFWTTRTAGISGIISIVVC